jgi:ADP-heptose:LPS heptosyltransferase
MSSESQATGIMYPQEDELKRICLIMFGLLGDVLMRTPLVRELRSLYPDAEITAFVDQSGREAISLSRLVDKVVVVNRSKRFARIDVLSKLQLFAEIRLRSFDLVIDLYMGSSSQLMTKYSGAPYQIFAGVEVAGFKIGKNTYLASKSFNFVNPHHLGCQFLRALFFLTPDRPNLCTRPEVGVDRLQFDVNKSTTNRDFINKRYFLVSVGAGDKRKIPELNTLAKLCLVIYEEKGLKPLIIKNPGMEYLQQSFSNELTSLGVPFRKADIMDLEAIAALMLSVRFVIVPDTGLLHLAIGLGVKIMAFFPYTNPELVRPNAKNYISIFEPDISSKPIPGLLPYGMGTPSIDNLLRMTVSFRNRI